MKHARNGLVQAMNKRHVAAKPMRDKRSKRKNNPKKSWKEDWR